MRSISMYLMSALALSACEDPGSKVPSATVAAPSEESTVAPAATSADGKVVATLAIAPSNTKIEFVGAKVTKSHYGGFTDFAGKLALGEPVDTSRVEITIQAASIYTDNEKLTKHLKSPDFFDVATYPTATFKSTGITGTASGRTVTGDLTLHGQTKQITFPATITASESEVSANAEFTINRHDFGITYPGMPDDLIRDNVVIKLSLKVPR